MVCSRSLLARLRPVVVTPRRPVSYTHATYQTTTIDQQGLPASETVDVFVTSETHKVGVVTQREYYDKDGNLRRETIPSQKWDPDMASASEEIIRAERKEGEKFHSFADMQTKSLKGLDEKEEKLAKAKSKPEDM